MSLLHAAAPYRRNERGSPRIPVVMPLVEVTVKEHGRLDVMLAREPYAADGELGRNDLKELLDDITAELGTPIRVEVREADGSTFTDIATPPQPAAPPADLPEPPVTPTNAIAGEGFLPNEDIAVAIVVAHQGARDNGTTQLRLPPALLEASPGRVILIGQASGTVVVGGDTA